MGDDMDETAPNYSHLNGSPRMLQNLPQAKICHFYRDGDVTHPASKLVINQRYYRNLDLVQSELTNRMNLPAGVRAIYTPTGKHKIHSLEDLQSDGKYVCSSKEARAQGVDLNRVSEVRPWMGAGRPASWQRRFNEQLKELPQSEYFRPRMKAWENDRRKLPPIYRSRDSQKKIMVFTNVNPDDRQTITISRRYVQSFEDFMVELGNLFHIPVRRIFTIDGRPVHNMSSIMYGPNTLVVTEGEKYKAKPRSDPGTAIVAVEESPRKKPRTTDAVAPRRAANGPFGPPAKQQAENESKPTVAPVKTVEKELKEKRERMVKTKGKWSVSVTTNELPSGGTCAQVLITVYGDRGHTDAIPLGVPGGEYFQPGRIDEFEINVGNIGNIYKIRLGHDNSGDFPGWFCDEIRMKDLMTGEELTFTCQKWMSRDEDDGEICREMPAQRISETPVQLLPVIKYLVTTVTGDLWNAGTDASVFVTLYGERGDTGVRLLNRNKEKKFLKGEAVTFTVEAVILGEIKRLVIGHDGRGPGAGWYLDKIIVKEPGNKNPKEWTFACRRWLDEGEDDGKIVRELKLFSEHGIDPEEKARWEIEKWKFNDGTQIVLLSKKTLCAVRIRADSSIDALAPVGGSTDPESIFTVLEQRGMIRTLRSSTHTKLHLGIDGGKVQAMIRAGPYCEFKVHMHEDRSASFESTKHLAQHVCISENGLPGDPRGSINDLTNSFFVYCKGVFRDQGIIMLCTSWIQTVNIDHDNMLYATGQRNRLAQFRVHKVAEGNIRMFESVVFPKQYIRFKEGRCDCQGSGDSYCHFRVGKVKDLGYVTFESVAQRGLFIGMTPTGQIRPTVNTGERNVCFYPEIIQYGRMKERKQSRIEEAVPVTSRMESRKSKETPTPKPLQTKKPEMTASSIDFVEKADDDAEEPMDEPVNDGDWRVWLQTLDTAKNGTIVVVGYGDQGSSGPITLGKAGANLFIAGNLDEFKVNLESVGKVYKVRLEFHTNDSRDASWRIGELKAQNMVTKELFKSSVNKWFSRHHEDRCVMREFPLQFLPVLKYSVSVYTGKEDDSQTSSNVFLTIFGDRGDSGKRELIQSHNKVKFLAGQMDVFEVEAVHLADLRRVLVSHDNTGGGWFLEKVIIKESKDDKKEYIFPCSKWFDTDRNDGKIERMLNIGDDIADDNEDDEFDDEKLDEEIKRISEMKESKETSPVPQEGFWQVSITTGSEGNMATANDVILYAYGNDGMVGPLTVGTGKTGQHFKAGQTDEFMVELGTTLGDLYKIRLGHTDMVAKSGWFLEKVKMKNVINEEQLLFKVQRWLARDYEDHDVWRELPVVRPGQKPLPVLKYRVEVFTGNEPGADCEANIYLQLFGSRGDAGKRQLYHSKTNKVKFQQGQKDEFDIEAVDLGELEKVLVRHDGHGKGAGWHLEKVVVMVGSGEEEKVYIFPCNQWLDEGIGDGKIERILYPQQPQKESMGQYNVTITTHYNSHPPKAASIFLTAYGKKGQSEEICLQKNLDDKWSFEPGTIDEFECNFGDIGELFKIRLSRQLGDSWEGWHPLEMKLKDKDTEKEYVIEMDRWLSENFDDHDIVREFAVPQGTSTMSSQQYAVSLHTGDHWEAGTDATVYITLFGSTSDSGRRYLLHSHSYDDKFQRNQVDTFHIEAVGLGDLQKVVIGHNGEGSGAGWFLDRITVTERSGPNANMIYLFPCNRWFDDHEEDKKTERELQLLDTKKLDEEPKRPKPGSKTLGKWKVLVKTSDNPDAGTHAQVILTVYGSKGNSGPQPLGKADPRGKQFEPGVESTFPINVGDIGEIYKIRLEHDNSNAFPSWHPEKLIMRDENTEEELVFYFNCWLAEDEDEKSLCKEVAASRPSHPTIPVLRYYVTVFTGNMKEAGTQARVHATLFGSRGDSGRRPLLNSLSHNLRFLPGQVDVFVLEAVHLGTLEKIQFEHDGKNKDASWFIEKVSVKESDLALSEFVFMCNQWVETINDRPALKDFPCSGFQQVAPLPAKEQALLPPALLPRGKWKLWVETENALNSTAEPVDSSISLLICGTQGVAGPFSLLTAPSASQRAKSNDQKSQSNDVSKEQKEYDKKRESFHFGAMHEQEILIDNEVGEIFKIRLTVDQNGQIPVWNMHKLKLKHVNTKQEFHFWGQQMTTSKGLGDAIIELPAVRPDIPPLQETTYTITVNTGSLPRADTNAPLFCLISGEWGDTGLRRLAVEKNGTKDLFQMGQADTFEIKAVGVGKVISLTVGHDVLGRGNGWYCEKAVLVENEKSDTATIFPCFRWLDSGCEDRKTWRVLTPAATVPIEKSLNAKDLKSNGVFKVWVKTSARIQQRDNAAFRVVKLMLFGEKGSSRPIELKNKDKDMFARGKRDEFDLSIGDIGMIYKLRLVVGDKPHPDIVWVIEEVTLQDLGTKEMLTFDFRRWEGEIGGDCTKELPAIRYAQELLPVKSYQVSVISDEIPDNQDLKSQETMQVMVNLRGAKSDSGPRWLNKNHSGLIKYQPGQVDVFSLEAVGLGDITEAVITVNQGYILHLHTLTIQDGTFSPVKLSAKPKRLIDASKLSVSIEVKDFIKEAGVVAIPIEKSPYLRKSEGVWLVTVHTGSEKPTPTKAKIVVTMCGEQGESLSQPLLHLPQQHHLFEPGTEATFEITVKENVGDLFKVRIDNEVTSPTPILYIDKIEFRDKHTHDNFTCQIHDWISVDDETDGWMELPVQWPWIETLPLLQYKIDIHTGKEPGSETDSRVYVKLIGERGTTGRRLLLKDRKGQRKYLAGEVNTFELEAINLGKLKKMVIGHDASGKDARWFLDQVVVSMPGNEQMTTIFPCSRWFAKDKDDKLIERELLAEGVKDENEDWIVEVDSGKNAPPKGEVVVTIYGTGGKTAELPLVTTVHGGKPFASGSNDKFKIRTNIAVDDVYKIRIGFSDRTKPDQTWHLEKLKLVNVSAGEEYDFETVSSPIKLDNDHDGQVEIPVHQSESQQEKHANKRLWQHLAVIKYEVEVVTGNINNGGSDANVSLLISGERGDTGKRRLLKSLTNKNKFEKGKSDVFEIFAVDLLNIKKLLIGHDGAGPNSDWYLEEVKVKAIAEGTENKVVRFPYSKWLRDSEVNGKAAEVELAPADS